MAGVLGMARFRFRLVRMTVVGLALAMVASLTSVSPVGANEDEIVGVSGWVRHRFRTFGLMTLDVLRNYRTTSCLTPRIQWLGLLGGRVQSGL